MQNKFTKIGAKITAAATMLAMFSTVSPALAAQATDMKDTLSRQAVSVSASHELSMTLPGAGITPATTGTLTVTYTGFGNLATTPDVICGTGTATASLATNVLTITSGGTACSGTLLVGSVTPFTATNPGSAGSKTVTLAGNAGIDGTFALAINDGDQVTVTATVDPTITFDLDTALTDTESAAAYSVPFGVLTPGTVVSSGATYNSIWADLSTNATSGAVVTVKNANGASGLVSASVPADNINNAAAAMVGTSENYGLCVISVTETAGGPLAKAGSYTAGTCTADGTTNDVKLLSSSTPGAILNTTGATIDAGRARIGVNVNAISTTNAHNDYTDTLTFVATGTF